MPTDELKSFKISDQVKKQVDKPRKKEAEVQSVGFPRIESVVEGDATAELSAMAERHAKLVEMTNDAALSKKDKAAAKKAAVAYERTRDVIEHLLSVKAGIQKAAQGS